MKITQVPLDIPIVVSFSGGRTSALMGRMLQVSPYWEKNEKIFVFANTGKEREETLKFVKQCDEAFQFNTTWVEAVISPNKGEGTRHRVVNYDTAIRNTDPDGPGHPFYDLCKKYGIPTSVAPNCTRELKAQPIKSFLNSIGVKKYWDAWGIRADEPSRQSPRPNTFYPMAELGITEPMVRSFWSKQCFDLELKDYQGNCDLCFKKSLRKRLTIMRENPEYVDFWNRMEGMQKTIADKPRDLVFDRKGLSIPELLELSQKDFLVAEDKEDRRKANPTIFDAIGVDQFDFDFETSCHCQAS